MQMKKKLAAVIAVAAIVVALVVTLVSCASEDKSSEPIISLIEQKARIDFETETFDPYAGISAAADDKDGNNVDMTGKIKVVLPEGAKYNDDRKVVFSALGDYVFTYYVSNGDNCWAAVNRTVEVRNIYNFYFASATLPVGYAVLDMLTNNYKTAMFILRQGTVDFAPIQDRLIYSSQAPVYSQQQQDEYVEMREKMALIAHYDPYSYFRVFFADNKSQMEVFVCIRQNIPTDRYEINLLSDGTATYNGACNPYRGANTIDLWNKNKNIYDDIYKKAYLGQELKFSDGNMLEDNHDSQQMAAFSIIAAQRENISIWCGYPEAIKSDDPLVQKEIDKANIVKKPFDKMYNELSEANKKLFTDTMKLDKAEFDKEYFNTDKKTVIITATKYYTNSMTTEQFFDVLDRIREDYKDYNILYKPHPQTIPSESNQSELFKYLSDNGIKILPGKLPMEVITWVYPEAIIGGFDSSLYMSVPEGCVGFFIAKDAGSLGEISRYLYNEGQFGTPKFYWKQA